MLTDPNSILAKKKGWFASMFKRLIKAKYSNDDNIWSDEEVHGIVSRPEVSRGRLAGFQQYLCNHLKVRNRSTNEQLKQDLVEHIWNKFRTDDTN